MNILRLFSIGAIPLVQSGCIALAYAYEPYYGLFAVAAFIATDLLLIPFFSSETQKIRTFAYSFPPLLLIVAVFGLLFIVESSAVKTAVIWTNALAQFLYSLSMYYALFRPENYQLRSLYHSETIIRVLLFFCLSSVVYGLAYYADVPYWGTFPVLCVAIALSLAGALAMRGIAVGSARWFLAALVLCVSEIFLVIAFLPSMYFVSALLWTAAAYMLTQLGLSSLQKENSRFEIMTTVGLALFVVVLVVVTSQWR